MPIDNSLSNNDIEIRVIKPQDRQKVLDFLRIYFYAEEPLTAGGIQDKEDEVFTMSNIDTGTCLMAVKTNTQNSKEDIVGAIMSGPKGPHEADLVFQKAAKLGSSNYGKILHLLAGIERDANVCQRFRVEKVLHVNGMGVDSKLRGQNIGGRLLTELKNMAKQLKYELLTADCTSYYSARLFERMGFECVNTKFYNDYLDENGKQVFQPQPPHDCIKTYAVKL